MADGAAAGGRGTGAGRRRGAAAQPDHGVPVVVTVSGGRRGGVARSLEPAAPLAAGPAALAAAADSAPARTPLELAADCRGAGAAGLDGGTHPAPAGAGPARPPGTAAPGDPLRAPPTGS